MADPCEGQCPPDDWRGTPSLTTGTITAPACPSIPPDPPDPCDSAVKPVEVFCEDGERTLRVTILAVGREDGLPVLEECDKTDYDLGPCSPETPEGTVTNVVTKICLKITPVKNVSDDYAVTFDDDIIHVDASGGAVTITLPDPSTRLSGQDRFIIKKVDSSGNVVTIDVAGGGNVEFASSQTLNTRGDGSPFYHDGAAYYAE